MITMVLSLAIMLVAAAAPRGAGAAEIKVLTAGAFKQVLLALLPFYSLIFGWLQAYGAPPAAFWP